MTPADMAEVLATCSAYDSRTVGIVDVAAWHQAIGYLDKTDAINAVARHYGHSRDRIMPADVAHEALAIRNERAAKAEPLALPGRFELDDIRDTRLRAGLAACARVLDVPAPGDDADSHTLAVARARRERTTPIPFRVRRQPTGPGVNLAKIPGPDWAKPEAREREAVALLHKAGRPCGRSACPNCQQTAGQRRAAA